MRGRLGAARGRSVRSLLHAVSGFGASLGRRLKLPLRIRQPAVERKYRLRIAGVGHGDLNGGKFGVPLIDLHAPNVLFGPRLVVDPDMAIGMEQEKRLFPSRGR